MKVRDKLGTVVGFTRRAGESTYTATLCLRDGSTMTTTLFGKPTLGDQIYLGTEPDDVFNVDVAELELRMLAYLESGEQPPPGVYEGTIVSVSDFELSNGTTVYELTMRVKDTDRVKL